MQQQRKKNKTHGRDIMIGELITQIKLLFKSKTYKQAYKEEKQKIDTIQAKNQARKDSGLKEIY